MENAAKALLMAGGILLAILVLTLAVTVGFSITNFGEVQEEERERQQIAKFNQQYEAYSKPLMYGTDVITVVNKVIENNGGLSEYDSYYFIQIELNLTKSYDRTITTKEVKDDGTITDLKIEKTEGIPSGKYTLELDKEENNKKLIDFFHNTTSDTVVYDETTKKITTTISALNSFKSSIFSCSTEYSPKTGRVNKLIIKEIIIN